jgi:hypothetical protein
MTQLVYFFLPFVKTLLLSNFIAFTALVLAYLAYRKSVFNKYESWDSLLRSLQQELKTQAPWLNASYPSDYENKEFLSPGKIVYDLSFETAKEIARRGIGDLGIINKELERVIALFNERVETFNSLLDYQKRAITADPILSGELVEKLQDLGLSAQDVSVNEFLSQVRRLRDSNNNRDKQLYYLATHLRNINRIIHNGLIGNGRETHHLSYLWKFMDSNIETVLKDFKKNIPCYVKCHKGIVFISLIVFIVMHFLFGYIGQ